MKKKRRKKSERVRERNSPLEGGREAEREERKYEQEKQDFSPSIEREKENECVWKCSERLSIFSKSSSAILTQRRQMANSVKTRRRLRQKRDRSKEFDKKRENIDSCKSENKKNGED